MVRGCHVILTLRASPAYRASEDLTLQVANAMASPAALRFRGSCGTADQREGLRALIPSRANGQLSRVYSGRVRRGRDSTVDRNVPGVSGCYVVRVCSGRVAWRSEPFTSKPYFDPTEQRDFGQIHMVQMVLFCPLFEGSGAGNGACFRDCPVSDSWVGRGSTPCRRRFRLCRA